LLLPEVVELLGVVELSDVLDEPDGEGGLAEVAGFGRIGTWTPGCNCEGLPSLSM
jgi:hypothetical protein